MLRYHALADPKLGGRHDLKSICVRVAAILNTIKFYRGRGPGAGLPGPPWIRYCHANGFSPGLIPNSN